MAQVQNICGECGARNEAGAGFCVFCHTFLAWDDEPEKASAGSSVRQTAPPPPREKTIRAATEPQVDTPAAESLTETGPPQDAPGGETSADTAAGCFRVEADKVSVDVAATGEPTLINLRIANTSTIVDGYAVEAPDGPEWLTVEGGQVQLLPGTKETVPLHLQIVSDTLVPTQNAQVTIRIKSLSQVPAHFDLPVRVVVPALDVPVRVHAEPRMLRVSDRDSAECDLVVDNSASNRPVRLSFTGSDPELAVRFAFDPPELDVGPGATGLVRVTATATEPEPGQVVSRSLTVKTQDGDRSVDTHITLQQSTTQAVEDPPLGLEVHPSLVRSVDGAPGRVRIVADNRGGAKWAHVKFVATDPEGVVDVMWAPARLDVPPGKTAQVEANLEAPPPAAGAEVSRTVTVKASYGLRTSTETVTFVQVTSPSPMETLEVRVEPSVTRVRDADSATVDIVVDNQHGRTVARVFLEGADPERAVGFTFASRTVEVEPGWARVIELKLDCWRPPPGQETTRQFTITVSDGKAEVQASGTLVQKSSRNAIELLSIELDPSVLRMTTWRRGMLDVRLDNSAGTQPVRVSMTGDDPENIVGFMFTPRVLDIPAGQRAISRAKVKINRASGDTEQTRPITIKASDGHLDARTDGELIQAAAPTYRLLARILFTVLGGLAMIFGAYRPWLANSDRRGVGLDLGYLAELFGRTVELGGVERMLSAGVVAIVLGVLTIFGLTGKTGWLTRMSSLLGALLLIALFVTFAVVGRDINPGSGAYIVLLGCVGGYIGGLLGRR